MPEGTTTAPRTYFEVLTAAVAEFATTGYVSEDRLDYWMSELRRAAERDVAPAATMVNEARDALHTEFAKLIEHGGILKFHPGVSRFTLSNIAPQLRDELNRRIMASAQLIKLDREKAITETLQRFSGWATSVPPGGSDVIARNPVKSDIRKSLARTPYEVRRCTIDQGHKLAASLNAIVAQESDALAARWQHHYVRYPRANHVVRDGKIYLIRGSWAHKQGLVQPGRVGYLDEITQPGEEINCRCTTTFLTLLRQLPPDMLTTKGKETLLAAREKLRLAS